MHVVADLRQIEVEEPAVGRGQHAAPQLLLHHVALGGEEALLDHQRAHPLGLGPEQPAQMVGRHHLVIIGVIVVGGGVVEAADILGQPVELLGHHVAGRLEHHMLEQMGEARAAARIVLGADVVPDLHRDVGAVRIADRIDAQAVGQGPRLIGDRRRRRRCSGPRPARCRGTAAAAAPRRNQQRFIVHPPPEPAPSLRRARRRASSLQRLGRFGQLQPAMLGGVALGLRRLDRLRSALRTARGSRR